MTIADDDQNPRPQKKLAKSLDAIAALRQAMEQRLAETRKIEPSPPLLREESRPEAEPLVSRPTNTSPYITTSIPPHPVPVEPSPPVTSSPLEPGEPPPNFPIIEPAKEPVTGLLKNDMKEPAKSIPKAEPPRAKTYGDLRQAVSGMQPPTDTPSSVGDEAIDLDALPPPMPPEPPFEEPKASVADEGIDPTRLYDPSEWSRIMFRIAERSQKLIMGYIERNKSLPKAETSFFTSNGLKDAFIELTNRLIHHPERFVESQLALWQGYAQIWQSALARLQGQPIHDIVKPAPVDRRFQDREWQSNWLFDYMKQVYLLTARQMQGWIKKETAELDPKVAKKIDFFTRQMVDAISPTNFWMTNPEVLRTIFESNGESVIKGLENLLSDLERGHGELRISMTDSKAFTIGENIAITPGTVVFENRLIQLIQYAPTTPSVHRVPLLILPPWINKYYILDLREKNSFIRYLVAQGYTVFVVSWVNPDARHALVNFDDYMVEGSIAAMREVRRITSEPNINAVGYCIGGTLLASTLAYLKATPEPPKDLPNVLSATYLVTLVDFSEPGDLGVFIDDELVMVAEEKMARQGYMDAATMSGVFNLLRANDLIWSYVVNNYLLGKEPVPFDILYWNADSTNMPAVMQSFYLRRMYLANKLIEPNGIAMKGVPIDLRSITVPSFMLSTREDHIAPWKSTYAATQIFGGPTKFTLASSGHIAGVVNHPSAQKYGYWTSKNQGRCPPTADAWFEGAEEHTGSWWPEWLQWLAPYAGEKIDARSVGSGIEPAPGRYAKVRAS